MGGGLLGAVATISIIRYWAAGFAGGGDSGFSSARGTRPNRRRGAVPRLLAMAVRHRGAPHKPVHLVADGVRDGRQPDRPAAGGRARRGHRAELHADRPVLEHRDSGRSQPAVPRAAAAEGGRQRLDDPRVRRDAARGGGVAGGAMGRPGGDARVRRVPDRSRPVGAVLRRRRRSDARRDQLQRPDGAEHAAAAAVSDRAALRNAQAAGASCPGRDARGGAARRRVRIPRGQLRRRVAGPRHRQAAPTELGRGPARRAAAQPESRAGTRLRNAATLAGAAATGGAGAAAAGTAAAAGGAGSAAASGSGAAGAAGAGTASGANGRAYRPPPTAQANAAGTLQNGLQTPSFAGREQGFANEKFEAEFRERSNPVSAEQARSALENLPNDTQRGIGQHSRMRRSAHRAHYLIYGLCAHVWLA